jgi:hypothetical protein
VQDGNGTVFDDSHDLERLAAIQQHITAEIEGIHISWDHLELT